MQKIPKIFKKYFWDINFQDIDPQKNKKYVIERLLEYGDPKAYRYLKRTYPKDFIGKIAKKSRRISNLTRNFWRVTSS